MDLQESKNKLDMLVMIGMSAQDSISEALRNFIYSFKNADLNKADGYFRTYKEYEGKHFTDEAKFIRYQKTKRSQDTTNISVNNTELRAFERLCKDYGIDICYLSRPPDLEELFERDKKGEVLSKSKQDILNAFTVKDQNGNKKLKNDASLIVFNTIDLDTMERVLDKLDEKMLNIEKRKQRAQDFLNNKRKVHAREKFKKQEISKE